MAGAKGTQSRLDRLEDVEFIARMCRRGRPARHRSDAGHSAPGIENEADLLADARALVMGAEVFALAETIWCDVVQAKATLTPAIHDQLIKRIEQIRPVDIVFGDDAMALAIERVTQHQRLLGPLVAEDHDEIGMYQALNGTQQGSDEVVALQRLR